MLSGRLVYDTVDLAIDIQPALFRQQLADVHILSRQKEMAAFQPENDLCFVKAAHIRNTCNDRLLSAVRLNAVGSSDRSGVFFDRLIAHLFHPFPHHAMLFFRQIDVLTPSRFLFMMLFGSVNEGREAE
jgi:hypothetical protein